MAAGAPSRHAGDMTTYATNITPFAAPTRDRTGPVLTTITGGIAAFVAILLIAAGTALFWVSEHKTDANGYYSTATHEYSTPTRALTTESLDVYLDQVQHDEISDLDFDPFTVDKTRRAGEGRPAIPTAQTFWVASSADGHPLDWKVRKGEWSVVMMNADGSPGVSVDASVGAKTPLIRDLAWWLTIPGIGLGLIALVLVVFGVRGLTRAGAQPPVATAVAST